jgi:hypothetical protein
MHLASAFAAGAFSGAGLFSRKGPFLNFGVASFDFSAVVGYC